MSLLTAGMGRSCCCLAGWTGLSEGEGNTVAVAGPRHGARRLSIARLMPDLVVHFRTTKLLRYFHSGSGVSRLVGFLRTISIKSLNLTWNCGETLPVRGLSTSATDRAWLGDVSILPRSLGVKTKGS